MVISIRSNSTSSTTARQASDAQEAMKKSMERTATGLRINKAADDAAGLAIAAQMTAELNGLFQASRNARDAVSLVQTAEGGLSEIGGMVDRLRTLAIQSASDVLGPQERQAIQQEVNQLEDEIGRVVGTTAFNGRKLLDGSMTSARFQIGPQAGQEVSIALDGVQVPNIDLTSFDGASRAITFLDTAVKALHDQQATLGATQNRLESTIRGLGAAADDVLASRSRIQDADVARESAERARSEVLARSSIAILAQANVIPGMAARLLGG
jgi:flagellin